MCVTCAWGHFFHLGFGFRKHGSWNLLFLRFLVNMRVFKRKYFGPIYILCYLFALNISVNWKNVPWLRVAANSRGNWDLAKHLQAFYAVFVSGISVICNVDWGIFNGVVGRSVSLPAAGLEVEFGPFWNWNSCIFDVRFSREVCFTQTLFLEHFTLF